MKFIKEHIVFILVLASCLILRLLPLFDYQFTLDEWSGLDRTRFNSFSELIEKGVKIDAHPAFVQVLIYYLTKCFGFTTWIIKLPFLLFSFGAIIYAYAFGLRNFSKHTGVFASVMFSYSLLFVFYAPIARMYISGVFFSMALLFHFFEIFFLKNTKPLHYFFLGLFALLSALNQHINALFAFSICASALLFLDKKNRKPYLITCLIVVLLYLPHLSVTLYQLGIGGIGFEQGGWLPKPQFSAVLDFLQVLLGTGKSYLVFIFFIVICFFANRQLIPMNLNLNKKRFYLTGLFILNYLIIYFYSVYRAPVFQYSVMLFSSVAMVVAVASLLDFKNKFFFYFTLQFICAVLIFKTYYRKDYLHQSVKNIFEYQFEKTAEYKKKYADKAVYPIYFDADTLMREIFFKKYNYSFDCKMTKDSVTQSLKHFSHFVANLKSDILILASSNPIHQAISQGYFPFMIENTETQGLNLKVYSKQFSNSASDDMVLNYSNFNIPGSYKYDKPTNIIYNKKNFTLFVDSFNEYPFSAKAPLADVSKNEGEVILVKAKLKLHQTNLSGVQLCISLNDIKKDSSYFFTATKSNDFVLDEDSCLTLYSMAYLGTDYKKIRENARVTAFIWNTHKEKFTLTQFEIKTIDFWPTKWNYWK